jgi:hypothetical protein
VTGELYSQRRNASTQSRGRGRPLPQNPFSTHGLCLINENDEVLHMSEATFIGMMSLAEQRGWRATALTHGDMSAFAATDASRCAIVLWSALEDELPPMISVGGGGGLSQVCVNVQQVRGFVGFCRNGGFWIRSGVGEMAGGAA